ncbi:MAG: WG repeat-containing protein [Cyanobacteriota bacterium]
MSINNLSIVNTEEKNILNLRSKYSSVKKINNEDLLIVSLNNKFGLINMKDEIIIPIEYEGLELDFNGYIDAKINNTNFVFDKNGKGKLYNRISKTSKDGIFITELNNKFGIIDQNNKEILPVIYDEIKSSDDNLFIAKNDGNLFIVKLDDKFGLVNYKGEFLLDINYKILFSLNLENKFVFQKNDKFGVIDINKKIIIEPIYDFISSFYSDLTTFSIDNKFLYLNKNLEVVFTSEYNAFIPYNYSNISYLMVQKDNKFGFIDKKGKVVVPVKYDKVKDIENGYFKVKLDGRWGTVDEKGNENFVDEIYVNDNPYSY